MSSSLENLVKNLENEDFKIVKKFFPKHFEFLKRKGIYPYDYIDNFEKLQEKQLPPFHEFYSKLNDEHISDEDYAHSKNIWEKFNMKNMADYHDLYLKTDVILLAGVFEKFRKVCKKNYDLDPAWYFTSPGLAWDAALKTTKTKLEILHQQDMHLMIEKGIRGGVSMITKRYSIANKYLQKGPTGASIYIPYLDANNLYGWSMMQKLPTHDFKWENKISSLKDLDKDRGYILEVDLDYPKELHDFHNDFPLAPEKINTNLGNGSSIEKLIPTLYSKKNYIIHYEILKNYLEKGLI